MAFQNNILITTRNKLICFKFENDQIEVLNEITLENEISAMTHFDTNGQLVLFLGHWMKKEITLVHLANNKIENYELTDRTGQVRSLAIQKQTLDENYILYIGTTDGTVYLNKFKLNDESNEIQFDSTYFDFVQIGLTTVKLHIRENDLIASCDEVAIFEVLDAKIKVTRIYLGIHKCNYFIPINTLLFENGIAWITDKNELKFVTLEKKLKLQWSTAAISNFN